MKIPKSYEGQLVCIHLGAPVYMFEYGAHVTVGNAVLLMPAPIVREVQGKDGPVKSQAMSNLLVGVRVEKVEDDSISVHLFVDHPKDPARCAVILKTIPSALVLSIDSVVSHDAEMPPSTQHIVQPPAKPLVRL